MLLMEAKRSMRAMPSQWNTSGISSCRRMSCTPATHSVSNMKSDALREQGIAIVEQVAIPDELIPADAQVEMDAKKAAGYFTPTKPTADLTKPKGRGLDE